jgi:UDP-glucose:glycoprotein glucosyltransferase
MTKRYFPVCFSIVTLHPSLSLTRAKLSDDGAVSSAEASSKFDSSTASGTLAGLDFDVLNVRYPDHATQLRELADSLQDDKLPDLQQEVKVWAIRELGLQAVQAAHASSQPLNTIRDLSHNLPSRVGALSRGAVSQEVRGAVATVQQL